MNDEPKSVSYLKTWFIAPPSGANVEQIAPEKATIIPVSGPSGVLEPQHVVITQAHGRIVAEDLFV